MKTRKDVRNIAVIAHVDHGKTTLVDAMLRQSGLLNEKNGQLDRVMDSNDLERERGITILAKNTAIRYGNVRINILDTPGHHDFGGEVERMLTMADAVLLLVDAAEGPLPQTRFVLQKALEMKLVPIVAINKIDRKDAEPGRVLNEVYDLFIDLGADESVLDFTVLYTNGRSGVAHRELDDGSTNLIPLFEAIIDHVPPPLDRRDEPLQLHVNNIGWDDYVGRIVLGRIHAGRIEAGQTVYLHTEAGSNPKPYRIMRLYGFSGLTRVEIDAARAGDIISLAGIDEVNIGDTITDAPDTPPLRRITVDEPTMSMNFCVNNSPFAGKEGRWVTSRNLRDRLFRESKANVAIRVEETESPDTYRVLGRGELQLGILVETMRREGYELMLSRPEVVTRRVDGKLMEPQEYLTVDCPQEMVGVVTERLGPRRGRLMEMAPFGDRMRLLFEIPTRGIIGFQGEFLTETRGLGVMHTRFAGWIPWQGPITGRRTGALVADRTGPTTPYALYHMQPRGTLFVPAQYKVYEGMVVGEHIRENDLNVNVCREKKLTNIRAAGRDENVILSPPRLLSLEQAMEFIRDDEMIEVTPLHIRIRKRTLAGNHRSVKLEYDDPE
jgi:GTP-binding protein